MKLFKAFCDAVAQFAKSPPGEDEIFIGRLAGDLRETRSQITVDQPMASYVARITASLLTQNGALQ